MGFPGGSDSKESTCNAGDPCLIPGSRRSPGEGNGYPLQCSCLHSSINRRAWRAWHSPLPSIILQMEMSLRNINISSQRFGHDLATEQQQQKGKFSFQRFSYACCSLKINSSGIPWWSGGWDSVISRPRVWVRFLVVKLGT